jgi:hypothetical protein
MTVAIAVVGAIVSVLSLIICVAASRGAIRLSTPKRWEGAFQDNWLRSWNVSTKQSFGWKNQEVAYDASAMTDVLRVRYPQGSGDLKSVVFKGWPLGGTSFMAEPLPPHDALHLRYYVKFDPGFDFAGGGELPGLYGSTESAKISTRFQWREGGEAALAISLAKTMLSFSAGNFVLGKWHYIEQSLKLNAPGIKDGHLRAWIDGKQVLDKTGLLFREEPTLKVRGILFSTYFGGADLSVATPVTTCASFTKFALSSQYIGQ